MDLRKRRQTFNEPGHAHELTFSCYRRLPLLATTCAKETFLKALDEARKRLQFEVWAYVVMREHVHLLIHPIRKEHRIAQKLMAIESSFAKQLLTELRSRDSEMLKKLVVRSRDGRPAYRVWQAGGGYDRNLFSPKAIHACINYIHANRVRSGLCESELDWPWSSARAYAGLESALRLDPCEVVLMESARRRA